MAVSQLYSDTPHDGAQDYAANVRNTARVKASCHSAMDQVLVAIKSAKDLEAKLQISEPWTESHPEYKATVLYLRQWDYHRMLDDIQQLVVQRLFQLSKANIMGMGMLYLIAPVPWLIDCIIGYKLREMVWRALKT
jgi:hypothetical protein